MNSIEEIAGAIKRLKSAVIFCHTRPDGDALGSALALSRALSLLKIKNQVVNDTEIPERYLFLEGIERIQRFPTLDAEGYLCVDSSDENRFGELTKTFLKGAKKGKVTVNIDHHISNTRYCQYNFVRERSSNCENVADLIEVLGVEEDVLIANYLMTGIITDSGVFSHSDVDSGTFRAAAKAVEIGADVNAITYNAIRKQTKARAEMYLKVLGGLRYLLDDKLVIAVVPQALLDEYGLKSDATEGIVDFGLTIDTVEVSVCLMESKKGQYKASFRSKGKVDVNAIAGIYGGGGHVLASGCMFFGGIEEIIDKLRYAVWQHLGEA